MKLTTKEREFLEHLLNEEYIKIGYTRKRFGELPKESKSDIKIVNSIKAKIIEEDL